MNSAELRERLEVLPETRTVENQSREDVIPTRAQFAQLVRERSEAAAALERLEKLEAAAMSVLENRRREKRANSTLGTLFRVVAILHYVLAATAVPDTDRLFARLTVGLCFAILGILHDDRAARKQGGEVNHD